MKISKLFHWLYGFLMLMPVFAVGVKCAYVCLNDNSMDSYSGSFKYATNINLNEYFTVNNIPLLSYEYNNITNYYYQDNNLLNSYNYKFTFDDINYQNAIGFNVSEIKINNNVYQNKFVLFSKTLSATSTKINIYDNFYNINDSSLVKNDSDFGLYYKNTVLQTTSTSLSVYNMTDHLVSIDMYLYDINIYYASNNNLFTNFLNKLYFDLYYVDTTLSSVFYSAVNELDSVSFFSWAKSSFLAVPFLYIGNLFGIPDVHPIFTFLSYWCAVSIIWLVFDFVMYVPLLAHRWLDKGILE